MIILNIQNIIFVCSIICASAVAVLPAAAGGEPPRAGGLAGTREALAEEGLSLEAGLTADLSKNVSGGVNPAGTFRHLFGFNTAFDLDKLAGLEGATFFLGFHTQEGQDGSEETGDLQAYSNIDSDDFTALYEVWYEQVFLGGDLRFKLGKIDANSEFAFVDFGGDFIHSSPGFSPTLFTLPTYPDPAFGAVAFVGENEGAYAGLGVFDGALQEGVPTGTRGPKTLFGDPADLFFIGEAGTRWGGGGGLLPGRVALGVWHHTGTFATFAGGTRSGATGFFLVFDQLLYEENSGADDGQGLGLFAQLGLAEEDLSAIDQHLGVGLEWRGLLPDRDDDVVGLMASYAGLSDEPGAGFTEDAEVAVELFYRVQLNSHLSVKPGVQHIANPGGAGLGDAWVLTLRLEAFF